MTALEKAYETKAPIDSVDFDSGFFYRTKYKIKDMHVVIMSTGNGKLAVELNSIPALCRELKEIYEVYSSVRTIPIRGGKNECRQMRKLRRSDT